MRNTVLGSIIIVAAVSLPAFAASSTSNGQVSVAQVVDMIDKSASDGTSRNISIAYLSGVGEAAGLLIQEAAKRGISLQCSGRLELSASHALNAVKTSTDESQWQEMAATPIIVADMLARAGCH